MATTTQKTLSDAEIEKIYFEHPFLANEAAEVKYQNMIAFARALLKAVN